MSTFRRRHGRSVGATILTLGVALGAATGLLFMLALIFLLATAPNWFGR